jgi:hypothetical protein
MVAMVRARAVAAAVALLSVCGGPRVVGSEMLGSSSVATSSHFEHSEVSQRALGAPANPPRVRRLDSLPLAPPRLSGAPTDSSASEVVVLRPVTVHDAGRVVASFRRWGR